MAPMAAPRIVGGAGDVAYAATNVVENFQPQGFPEPGDEFLGFRLIDELGRGSFGRVFLALQPALGARLVVLKVAADLAQDCEALAQLRHTNVVPVYSVHQSGTLTAICMPYLGPCTLHQVLRKAHADGFVPHSGAELLSSWRLARTTIANARAATRTEDAAEPVADAGPRPRLLEAEPLPSTLEALRELPYPLAVCRLVAALADGLAHAHRHHILHRDIKPANVLIADDGEPMLVDFGLAEDLKRRGAGGVRRPGGTAPYMSPEQFAENADDATAIDHRSDIFSLGAVLFEALTGQAPFPDRGKDYDPAVPLPAPSARVRNPSVPAVVDAVVAKCLAHDPADRYAAAEHLAEDLRLCLEGRSLKHADDPAPLARLDRFCARHWKPLLAAGSAAAVAAGIVVALMLSARQARTAAVAGFERQAPELLRNWIRLHAQLARLDDFRGPRDEAAKLVAECGVAGAAAWPKTPGFANLDAERAAQLKERVARTLLALAEAGLTEGLAVPERRAALVAEARLRIEQAAQSWPADSPPRAVAWLRARAADVAGEPNAEALKKAAEAVPLAGPDDALRFAAVAGAARHHAAALAAAAESHSRAFSALYVQGVAELARGDVPAAVQRLQRCVGVRADDEFLHLLIGHSHLAVRSSAPASAVDALHHYSVAAHLRGGKDAEALLGRATVLHRLGGNGAAMMDLDAVARLGAVGPEYWSRRAAVATKLGMAAESKKAFEQVSKAPPRTPRDQTAALLARGKDVPRSAVAKPLPWAPTRDHPARFLEGAAALVAALPELRQELALEPENPGPRHWLALAEAAAGRRDAALAWLTPPKGTSPSPNTTAWAVAAVHSQLSKENPAELETAKRELAKVSGDAKFEATVRTKPYFEPLRKATGFEAWIAEMREEGARRNGVAQKIAAAEAQVPAAVE